ncbi:AAA family ATPase [Cryptosporangium aurantiacum]|uniref:AAA family ATPase n=1 Tax=Cryptosporangium aurantiacum TaxID=134849 RepID=UPI0009332B21|nr:LuxR family transcriptional regulator [Cryptosporangium aurantiacum]
MADDAGALLGRREECNALDRLVADVAGGTSRVLVVRGEAGAGKSALLRYLIARTEPWCLLSAAGVESELELAYSGLHQLCMPLADGIPSLPAPQRTALGIVFGMDSGPAPDRFLVGLGVLSLLAGAADRQPVLCVIDDAQWLDRASAQILAFVARRLLAERVAVVGAVRTGAGHDVLAELPNLYVDGLTDADAHVLLRRSFPGGLDPAVRHQIVAESRGNPLALLELPRTWRAADLAGGFGLPEGRTVAGRIEQSYVHRLRELPADTRLLVLTAAAEPLGDPVRLHDATRVLGVDPAASVPAADAGLMEIHERVRFAHPLVRSAAYRAASTADRHRVHRALADVTDIETDPDRRAWHRARAAFAPDEDVAAELERSAGRAQSRGGVAAAAAFLTSAAQLTPERSARLRRTLDAAFAHVAAGEIDTTRSLLATVEDGPADEWHQARLDLLRARLAFASSRGKEATPLLLAAARRLEPLDPRLARETYLDALMTGWIGSRLNEGVTAATAAVAARTAPPPDQPTPGDLLLAAYTALTADFAEAVPACRAAIQALREDTTPPEQQLRWLWEGALLAVSLRDEESWDLLSERHLRAARRVGALQELPFILGCRGPLLMYRGELSAAWALAEENNAINEVIGIKITAYGAGCVAAARGDEPLARALIADALRSAEAADEGSGIGLAESWHALLCNGLGRYDEALTAALRSTANPNELSPHAYGLPELVEAASRTGRLDVAQEALDRLSTQTRASGTAWALGVEARARALVTGDEEHYRAAIDCLSRTGARADLARTYLVYGEWLRRESRRTDAKRELGVAFEMLSTIGMAGFAERARRELTTVGASVRKRETATTPTTLTAQETQIARLAQAGLSNPEIGAQLFLSARTIEWHLRKVFGKLGITSRRQLRGVRLP